MRKVFEKKQFTKRRIIKIIEIMIKESNDNLK